jgi:hypothetical protein
MRLLLIRDTHGKIGIINELAAHVRADAIIHSRSHLSRNGSPDATLFITGLYLPQLIENLRNSISYQRSGRCR